MATENPNETTKPVEAEGERKVRETDRSFYDRHQVAVNSVGIGTLLAGAVLGGLALWQRFKS